jgi:hypothetical protein
MVTTRTGADPPSAVPTPAAASDSSNKEKRSYGYIHSSTLAQFAQDIEEAGGIQKCIGQSRHLYTRILSRHDRKKLYFPPNDPKLHERLQKKCWIWQQLYKKGEYADKVLSRYGVQASDYQDIAKDLDKVFQASCSVQDNPQAAAVVDIKPHRAATTFIQKMPPKANSPLLPPQTSTYHMFAPLNFVTTNVSSTNRKPFCSFRGG